MIVVAKEEKTKDGTPAVKTPAPISYPPLAKTLMEAGKFEVKPDQTFTVKLYLQEYKGRWTITDRPSAGVETHTVIFRMWNFDECLKLRRDATFFDPTVRANKVDNDKLNRMKIMKFLVEWTLSKDNPRLEIHRVKGTLTDESWKAFTRLSPVVADKIISEMNLVLEYGG